MIKRDELGNIIRRKVQAVIKSSDTILKQVIKEKKIAELKKIKDALPIEKEVEIEPKFKLPYEVSDKDFEKALTKKFKKDLVLIDKFSIFMSKSDSRTKLMFKMIIMGAKEEELKANNFFGAPLQSAIQKLSKRGCNCK